MCVNSWYHFAKGLNYFVFNLLCNNNDLICLFQYNCTLYCMVTYTAGDSAPEMASDCTYPTTSTYELLQAFDNIQ